MGRAEKLGESVADGKGKGEGGEKGAQEVRG